MPWLPAYNTEIKNNENNFKFFFKSSLRLNFGCETVKMHIFCTVLANFIWIIEINLGDTSRKLNIGLLRIINRNSYTTYLKSNKTFSVPVWKIGAFSYLLYTWRLQLLLLLIMFWHTQKVLKFDSKWEK